MKILKYSLYLVSILLIIVGYISIAEGIMIDNPLPAFDDPPSPWVSLADEPIITYAFKTSHDGILWTEEQKSAAYDALMNLDNYLPNQTFEETGDFTLRWAGSDFFKDWRDSTTYTDAGWNMGGEPFTDTNGNGWRDAGEPFTDQDGDGNYDAPPLAVAYKHNNGPWDHTAYPNNEIYFNNNAPFSYSLFGVDADKYDFWTILLHEAIHMLACDDHATDKDEVMYAYISAGERKYIQQSDLDILVKSGYTVVPEPTTMLLVGSGIIGLRFIRRKKFRKG